MRLNPKIPLSNGFQARIAAQEIVFRSFNMKEVVKALRPDLKQHNAFAVKLMDEPQVRLEIQKIMDRTENNATKFVKRMWEWMDAPPDETGMNKEVAENRRTAARILAKGYISEKKVETAPAKPVFVDGMESGLANLTGVT